MFKKIALTLVFLATFAVGGLSTLDTAEAWRYRGRPYVNYYWGTPRAYYYGNYYRAPYRNYSSFYAPRVVVQPYYYGPDYYYGGPIYR
jgi:hypothetical protein